MKSMIWSCQIKLAFWILFLQSMVVLYIPWTTTPTLRNHLWTSRRRFPSAMFSFVVFVIFQVFNTNSASKASKVFLLYSAQFRAVANLYGTNLAFIPISPAHNTFLTDISTVSIFYSPSSIHPWPCWLWFKVTHVTFKTIYYF